MKTLLLMLSLLPLITFGQTPEQRNITVRGESEINIAPDRIDLTIVFSETENIKKENELQLKENELIKLLKNFSIDLKDLNIDNFSANRYGYYKSSSTKVRMSKAFKLQLGKIEIVDTLIIKLFEIGANNVAITNLHSNKLEEMKLEATKIALDKAKIKAQTMAEHMGYSLGQIIEIREYNPEFGTFNNPDRFLYEKTVAGYGVNRIINSDGEDIGIRKIRIRYIVDVQFELK